MLQQEEGLGQFKELLNNSPQYEQRTILTSVLKMISKRYLTAAPPLEQEQWWKTDAPLVSASARLILIVLDGNSTRRTFLISWLTSSTGAGSGETVGIRRAVIAALAEKRDDLEMVLEKSIAQFGDQLYIKHTPILQQEGMYKVEVNIVNKANLVISTYASSAPRSGLRSSHKSCAPTYASEIGPIS